MIILFSGIFSGACTNVVRRKMPVVHALLTKNNNNNNIMMTVLASQTVNESPITEPLHSISCDAVHFVFGREPLQSPTATTGLSSQRRYQ